MIYVRIISTGDEPKNERKIEWTGDDWVKL